MALWKKNSAQKHSVIEVIKYDGPNDILIWKHPNEDFNTNTQLIVGPSQEAIFVKGGQILEHITIPGTYTLNTKNYPFIRGLVELTTWGVSPFSCAVYYVNKTVSMGIEWATDKLISVFDPHFGAPIGIGSYGDFSLQVENGQKLMEKLVGQTIGFGHKEIQEFFKKMIAMHVGSVIAGTMLEYKLSPISIATHLPDMSKTATEKIRPIFEPYGLTLVHFTIAAINSPDMEELEQKSREVTQQKMTIDLDHYRKITDGDAQEYVNRVLGITEQQKWIAQIGQKLAGNIGPVVGGGGAMPYPGIVGGNNVQPAAAGTAEIARMLQNQPAQVPQQPQEDISGVMPGGDMMEMMEEAETKPVAAQLSQEQFEARADKLKYLLDKGMITQEQFDKKINELI